MTQSDTLAIKDEPYAEGRAEFETGGTLRGLIERLKAAEEEAATTGDDAALETYISQAVGFFDAALDKLRALG